jgi:molybdate transport system substrate-binding protein
LVKLGQLLALALTGLSLAAGAAEISILSGGAVKSPLSEAAARYERASGHRVAIEYQPVGVLMKQLAQGAQPDLVVITEDVMADAAAKGWLVGGTAMPLGSVGVGVAVHEGAASPDISSPDALRKALLDAKSITYIDPEKGTSGKHFAGVLQGLGIADAVRAKTRLGAAGFVVEPVARGEIELGIQQITEILPVKGVKLVGPLPASLQKLTTYTIARTVHSRDAEAIDRFLEYLRGAESRALFLSRGFTAP